MDFHQQMLQMQHMQMQHMPPMQHMQMQQMPPMQQMQIQQMLHMQQMQQIQQMQQMKLKSNTMEVNPQHNQKILLQHQMMNNLMMGIQQEQQQKYGIFMNVKDVNWLKANLEEFNSYESEEKKDILGNMMHAKVVDLANPKSVPMIIDRLTDLNVLSIQEIIQILSDDDILLERIGEAIRIIDDDYDED